MDDEEYEELISFLTPQESEPGVTTYRNTTAIACPACDDPFDALVICHDEYTSLELSLMLDLCTTIHDGEVLLFTHKHA